MFSLKQFEKFVKKKLRSIVFKINSQKEPKKVCSKADELLDCEKILFLRQDRIGDLIVSIPLFEAFRQNFPKKHFYLLLSHRNWVAKNLVVGYFDQIIIFPKNPFKRLITLFKLRKIRFDLVVDLFDNPSFTSSLIISFINPRYSLGFEKENRKVYTHIIPLPDKLLTHIIDRLLTILIPFGIDLDSLERGINIQVSKQCSLPVKTKKRLGLVISGSTRAKFWGTENFSSLIELINKEFDFDIVIFATKEYKEEIEFFKKLKNVQIAPFTNDFEEFVSMVSTCDYIISPDTSVVHLASAFKIPIVAMYTFADPKFGMPWFPYGVKYRAVISKMDSYADITPYQVFNSLVELIHK